MNDKKLESLERKYKLVTSEVYQEIRKLIIEELIDDSSTLASNDIPVFMRLIKRIDNWASEYTSYVSSKKKQREGE